MVQMAKSSITYDNLSRNRMVGGENQVAQHFHFSPDGSFGLICMQIQYKYAHHIYIYIYSNHKITQNLIFPFDCMDPSLIS